MPNQRAAGQRLISVPMNEDFISSIDGALAHMGFSDRSSFIRTAIIQKLRRENIKIPEGVELAPSRTGKGGPRKK